MESSGQSSTEYTVMYSWILLVVFFASAAIFYFIVLPGFKSEKIGFSQVEPQDWRLGADGNLTVVVKNTAPGPVWLKAEETSAYIVEGGSGECFLGGAGAGIQFDELKSGATHRISFIKCMDSGNAGESYTVNLTLNYATSSTGNTRKSTGLLYGTVE
jgi:hypothetical protein